MGRREPEKLDEEVEFEVEMRIVTKARLKPEPIDPDAIPMTKQPDECITEFFERENEILSMYADFIKAT